MRTEQSGLPCAMALRLIPRSPRGPGFIAPVIARNRVSRNLAPASGRQDHTALPYAIASLVGRNYRVHRISGPTFVTTAKRPSCGPGWREENHIFLENGRDIFALTF